MTLVENEAIHDNKGDIKVHEFKDYMTSLQICI